MPASCEIAISTPPCLRVERRPRTRRASGRPSSAAPAIAACSLVPQPVMHDRLALADRLRRLDRPGRGEDRRHQPRLGQDHLLHRPRRAVAQLGHVAHGRRRYRREWPVRQGHFDADRTVPLWSCSPAGPRRRPLRAQLEDAICAAITGGGAPPGTRLPASRVLAETLARLARRGERGVRADRRRGLDRDPPRRPRRSSARVAAAARARPSAGGGTVRAVAGSVATRAAARPHGDRARPLRVPAAGVGGGAAAGARRDARRGARLRRPARRRGAARASSRRISCACAARAAPAELVVTSGYTQGLWLTCRALARARRDGGWRSRTRRWTTRGRRSAPPGWRSSACRSTSTGSSRTRSDADAVLVTPAHQFPTGAVLAPERRRALLAWGGIVLEDDYDSEYRYDRAPVGTLQRLAPDRVVYLGTASKTLAPGAAARAGCWRRRSSPRRSPSERWAVDSGGPAITARAYAQLIATGELDRHLRRTRREYRERRDALVDGARTSGCRTCRVDGRRRRPAPAAAAAARHRRGGGGRRACRSAGSASAGCTSYALTPHRASPRS